MRSPALGGLAGGLVAGLLLLACGPGDGSTLDERGRSFEHPYAPGLASRFGTNLAEATYEAIAFEFLEPFCGDCHGTTAPSKGLDLTYERGYEQMVGIPSLQVSSLSLIEPGDPDASYLIIKLEGGPGMVGRQMPRGRPARPQDEIDLIRAWIEAGAPRD